MSDQEFIVRIPARIEGKKYHIMKFNASMNVDVGKWSQVRMVRENNRKEKAQDDEMPEYGAGSEYGRAQREEARRKKYGFVASKKYHPDAQPWLMRVGNKKEGKHYKGVREGGVSENTTYYVFTHAQDGSFEAHPVKEWYNFTPRATYKTLNAEEAEEKFAERGKILSHWATMVNKKLKPDQELDGDDLDGDASSKKSKKDQKAAKSLKISDMDDWVDSDDGFNSDEDNEKGSDEEDGKKKKDDGKGKDSRKKKKKSKEDVENEAFEDSDDGDDEDREVDYITDESSESEDENPTYDQKGVDQAEALAKMLDSESSSDEEEKKESGDEDGDDEDETGKKKNKKGDKKGKNDENGKEEDKNDAEDDEKTRKAEKRRLLVEGVLDPNAADPSAKRSRMDPFQPSAGTSQLPGTSATSEESSLEEDVKRYLARKPMTTTDILRKIKSKRPGMTKDELLPLLVSALKRINPHKQKVKGVMYISLKPNK